MTADLSVREREGGGSKKVGEGKKITQITYRTAGAVAAAIAITHRAPPDTDRKGIASPSVTELCIIVVM